MERKHDAYDAVVVGSGPNGLAAAVYLRQQGASVLVIEGSDTLGGGTRTRSLTLPGFRHDMCSAAHPMGVLSPFFKGLPLEEHGLTWIHPPASVAHPLDKEPAAIMWQSLEQTCAELGVDGAAYRRMVAPFLARADDLLEDALAPLKFPKNPWLMMRFGLMGLRSATGLASRLFKTDMARALFAGCAAHAIQPLEHLLTSALGLIFAVTGHVKSWPVVAGGSQGISMALTNYLRHLGGECLTGQWITQLSDLPPARLYLFDTSPKQLADIAGDVLPSRYVRRLNRYRYGPGTFKVDWALDGSIPWRDPRCGYASTVHVGGTLDEIADAERQVWRGDHPERPFVLLVQQSEFDDLRAPPGQHTGYAYCHVPANSTVDMTSMIEQQIERFAPGFGDRILARHTTSAMDWPKYNPNYVGGAITGGVADLFQLFTRPVARLNPYTTPNPRVLICSASTPPGGGVHGMCGYYAARTAFRRLNRFSVGPLGSV